MEIGSAPQLQQNGTYMSNDELLQGQSGAMNALVINKTIEKSNEVAGAHRASAMQAFGKGLRIDTSA